MNILISSCLLGEDVRYDGENSSLTLNNSSTFQEKELFMDIICNNSIYSFCPEVSGGLGIPRNAAEITSIQKPFKVETNTGEDVTINFLMGAKNALDVCKKENIDIAVLKSKSPSCSNSEIYDGTFSGKLIKEMGLTAKLLEQNQIKVFNETQIIELAEHLGMEIPTNKIKIQF